MDNLNIIKILGIGLSGFGFLLMYLGYNLIRSIIRLQQPNALVVKTINRYLVTSSLMTVIVGVFTLITTWFKNDLIERQSGEIKDYNYYLHVLDASQKNRLIADSVLQYANKTDISPIVKRQAKLLEGLSLKIAEKKDTIMQARFNKLQKAATVISDSLNIKDLDQSKVESLKKRYIQVNNSITELSLKLVKERTGLK